jgi:hypothetical protein
MKRSWESWRSPSPSTHCGSGLADELSANAAQRSARVLVGRCWETGGAAAYWPWVQLLRWLTRDSDLAAMRGRTARACTRSLDSFPELNAPHLHVAELAHHFTPAVPAGKVGKAAQYTRRAGDRALGLLAYEEAARLYEVALETLDLEPGVEPEGRRELSLALQDARRRAGDTR